MKKLLDISNNIKKELISLKVIRKINSNDIELLQEMKEIYQDMDASTTVDLKLVLTLLTSCIQQERIYFALSRTILKNLMLRNINIPKKYRKSFSNKDYSFLLAKLMNEYSVVELVAQGDKRKASIYKLIEVNSLKYLEKIVDVKEQETKALEFNK